jgi:hypothetical protein
VESKLPGLAVNLDRKWRCISNDSAVRMKIAKRVHVGIIRVSAAPGIWMVLLLLIGLAAESALRGDDASRPTYFLVELRQPWYDSLGTVPRQSCVLPLLTPEHIAHARELIKADAIHNWDTSLAKVAHIHIQAGTDGVNRDFTVPGFPAWSWHVTDCFGFSDFILGIYLQMIPSYIEQDPEFAVGWGIALAGMTVTRELGPVPLFLDIEAHGEEWRFYWSGVGTNAVYTLETADSLTSTNWVPVVSGLTDAKVNEWSMPKPDGAPQFYRVQADVVPP